MDPSIQGKVTATLSELGQPAPTNFIQTMLMKDGYFVGWKSRYDGGSAILHTGGNVMEVFDEEGTLLKTIGLEDKTEEAA
jgi:hypothetical protein